MVFYFEGREILTLKNNEVVSSLLYKKGSDLNDSDNFLSDLVDITNHLRKHSLDNSVPATPITHFKEGKKFTPSQQRNIRRPVAANILILSSMKNFQKNILLADSIKSDSKESVGIGTIVVSTDWEANYSIDIKSKRKKR